MDACVTMYVVLVIVLIDDDDGLVERRTEVCDCCLIEEFGSIHS